MSETDLTARVSGNDPNSVAAFHRAGAAKVRQTQRERILLALNAVRPHGLTTKELQARLGIDHSAAGPRVLELLDAGQIHRPGEKRAGAYVLYPGPGVVARRATKDGVPRQRLAALEAFCAAVRVTIQQGRLSGPGLDGMARKLAELGFHA